MHDAILALQWVELLLVVSDPVGDAQEDAEPMQTVHVARLGLGHGDQDLFRLGLAQDLRERLQKNLEVTIMSLIICPSWHSVTQSHCCKNTSEKKQRIGVSLKKTSKAGSCCVCPKVGMTTAKQIITTTSSI